MAGREQQRLEVEHRRDQHDSIERHAVALETVTQHRGAGRAVALADQVFRRRPAAVAAHVLRDELRQRLGVFVHAPEILPGTFAHGLGESRADGIDEHHVGDVDQAVRVVHHLVRWRRRGGRVGGHDAARTKGAHVQPGRGGAWPTIIDEGERPLAGVLRVGPRVRRVVEGADGLVLVVLEQHRGGGGAIRHELAADADRVIGGRRRLVGNRRGLGGVALRRRRGGSGPLRTQRQGENAGRQDEYAESHRVSRMRIKD